MVESLRLLSQSDSLGMHIGLVRVCHSDPSPGTAAARVDLLLDDGCRLWLTMDRRDPTSGLEYGSLYKLYAKSLSEIVGAPALVRSRLDGAVGGRRSMLLVALAYAGDAGVHDELVEEITHAASHEIRAVGVEALAAGKIITPQDSAWLHELSESDPFACSDHEIPTTPRYPVRVAARLALRSLGEHRVPDAQK
jgi:hypothetical protein